MRNVEDLNDVLDDMSTVQSNFVLEKTLPSSVEAEVHCATDIAATGIAWRCDAGALGDATAITHHQVALKRRHNLAAFASWTAYSSLSSSSRLLSRIASQQAVSGCFSQRTDEPRLCTNPSLIITSIIFAAASRSCREAAVLPPADYLLNNDFRSRNSPIHISTILSPVKKIDLPLNLYPKQLLGRARC